MAPEREPPENAPNVLLIVLDDVGFAQIGCYGSDIATPNIDRLAASGVRFSNFHTAALCSPTRSCLLTGRNHHSNGMGRVADLASGYPGYSGDIPRANGFLSEILRAQGYATYAVGKWHLTPDDETHMAGDRSSWPLGRGFDRWYGFHGGETHQFVPTLYCDNHSVQPPRTIDEGYHLSADLADRAIEYVSDLRNVDSEQPFFLYFATGRATRRTKRRPTGSRATAASSTTGGIVGANERTRASSRAGSSRRGPRSHRDPSGYRRGTTCTSPIRRLPPGSWSASPRSSRTPTTRSVACWTSSRSPAISTTR